MIDAALEIARVFPGHDVFNLLGIPVEERDDEMLLQVYDRAARFVERHRRK